MLLVHINSQKTEEEDPPEQNNHNTSSTLGLYGTGVLSFMDEPVCHRGHKEERVPACPECLNQVVRVLRKILWWAEVNGQQEVAIEAREGLGLVNQKYDVNPERLKDILP